MVSCIKVYIWLVLVSFKSVDMVSDGKLYKGILLVLVSCFQNFYRVSDVELYSRWHMVNVGLYRR